VFYQSSAMGLSNGPLANLRLTIATNGPSNVKVGWPNTAPNVYYGFILQETAKFEPIGPRASNSLWLSVSNATNGAIIPHSQPNRFYQLIKGPNSP
jgi:hypothetical protein